MNNHTSTVVVIADTHIQRISELPPTLLSVLPRADYVIHLGDYTSLELLTELKKFKKFHGISGNHDGPAVSQELKQSDVVEIEGKRFGLIHGMTFPFAGQKRMKAWFRKERLDAILYGHTHVATRKLLDGVLLFNPGSVRGKFPSFQGSFGVLTVNGTIDAKIITLSYVNPRAFIPFLKSVCQHLLRWVESLPDMNLYLARRKLLKLSLSFKRLMLRTSYFFYTIVN